MDYLNMNDQKLLPVATELNTLLADYHIYYQKLRNFHWNILGKNFFDLHNQFEALYDDAKMKIDEIAERILTLRFHPVSRFAEYLNISSLKETSGLITDREMVSEILKDHKQILMQMRIVISHAEKAGDEGSIDMMGSYIAQLEKSSWMLDAWSKNTQDQLKTEVIKNTL
ncbi:Dps family protein [Sungkyunkwania multivorans]|uniref:Dps family protein n=1 Tax=Sungkyunkwania multivorans TaxID=1173618 RepID=A0ABW3CTQ7_9FLAO